MNEKNYLNWFKSKGWKQYLIPLVLCLFFNIVFFTNYNSIIEESDSLFAVILATLVLISATIGMAYHSYDSWKNWKEDKKR